MRPIALRTRSHGQPPHALAYLIGATSLFVTVHILRPGDAWSFEQATPRLGLSGKVIGRDGKPLAGALNRTTTTA